MNQFAIYLGDNVTSYQQYNASNQPPAPTDVDSPPVYYINGVTGTVTPDAYYQSTVPVYANAGLGHQHMFARVLHKGDQGDDVETLQAALNQQLGTQLDTDGIFGPQTAQAVADYQTKHGLPGTPGVVDFNMWNSLNLSQPETTVSAGQPVQIDEIVQGMVGNQVTEWYHIPSVNGWIQLNGCNAQQRVQDHGAQSVVCEVCVCTCYGRKWKTNRHFACRRLCGVNGANGWRQNPDSV